MCATAIATPDTERPPVRPSFITGLPITAAALEFAAGRHGGQRRDSDRAAFVLHPLEVAWLLHSTGEPDELVAAGLLHDVLEDTDTRRDELRERFGERVADTVARLTENERIADAAERKAELRRRIEGASMAVATIFAADKVAKVRELRIKRACNIAAPEVSWKLDHYKASLPVLEQALTPSHPLVAELRFELETLIALPPA